AELRLIAPCRIPVDVDINLDRGIALLIAVEGFYGYAVSGVPHLVMDSTVVQGLDAVFPEVPCQFLADPDDIVPWIAVEARHILSAQVRFLQDIAFARVRMINKHLRALFRHVQLQRL